MSEDILKRKAEEEAEDAPEPKKMALDEPEKEESAAAEQQQDAPDSGMAEDPEPVVNAPSVADSEPEPAKNDAVPEEKSTTTKPAGVPKYTIVVNDGSDDALIQLITLKSLFARQLPKMPRAYIARLVLDPRHTSLALWHENQIIGGICYRAFQTEKVGEIAFCAVDASHQVKGYGTQLMNLLKHVGAQTGIEYFITYADNYAIGYFKKQGFSKTISMPKGRYFGLIKDYEGGTPMECYVHPSVDFLRVKEMVQAQREFLLKQVAKTATSHIVYDPLPADWENPTKDPTISLTIPGVVEAGWTLPDLMVAPERSALRTELLGIVRKLEEQHFAWPFRQPVNPDEVPDYLDIIKEPMDLSTMEQKIGTYQTKDQLYADVRLMVQNCKTFNPPESTYAQCAVKLEKYAAGLFV